MFDDPSMEFFAYASRSKVQQLHEQLGTFTASQWSEKRALGGKGELDAGVGALFGFLKAGLKASSSKTVEIEKRGSQSTVQMLREVLAHIEKHEKVLDLNELCKKKASEPLDAFAYAYEGNFYAQAEFEPTNRLWSRRAGVNVHEAALERDGEVVISKKYLVDPGRAECAFEERGPNNGKLTSQICIITSLCEGIRISLSCSYKYFTDMGAAGMRVTKSGTFILIPETIFSLKEENRIGSNR